MRRSFSLRKGSGAWPKACSTVLRIKAIQSARPATKLR